MKCEWTAKVDSMTGRKPFLRFAFYSYGGGSVFSFLFFFEEDSKMLQFFQLCSIRTCVSIRFLLPPGESQLVWFSSFPLVHAPLSPPSLFIGLPSPFAGWMSTRLSINRNVYPIPAIRFSFNQHLAPSSLLLVFVPGWVVLVCGLKSQVLWLWLYSSITV